jgi:hypothetical protein
MGRIAAEDGKCIEIIIYGGSCIMLASDIRESTKDIDAIFKTDSDYCYDVADVVGRQMQLSRDWLNQGVSGTILRTANQPSTSLLHDYPVSDPGEQLGQIGLRAFVPNPEYILALKIAILDRGNLPEETAKHQQDDDDAIALMRVSGLRTEQQLIDLTRQCFPHLPAMKDKIDARIKHLVHLDASTPDDHPTWNAERSSSTIIEPR